MFEDLLRYLGMRLNLKHQLIWPPIMSILILCGMVVFLQWADEKQPLGSMNWVLGVGLALLGGTTLITLVKCLQVGSKVEKVTDGFRNQQHGKFSMIQEKPPRNELGDLIIMANQMITLFESTVDELKIVHASRKAMVAELVIGLSERINDPLTVISGHAQLLQSMLHEGIPKDRAIQASKLIELHAQKIEGIVNQLQSHGNHSGQRQPTTVNFYGIFSDVISLFKPKLQHHDIKLTESCPSEVDMECLPSEVYQIFMILLSEAVSTVANLDRRVIRVNALTNPENVSLMIYFSGHLSPNTSTFSESSIRKLIDRHGGLFRVEKLQDSTSYILDLSRRYRPKDPLPGQAA